MSRYCPSGRTDAGRPVPPRLLHLEDGVGDYIWLVIALPLAGAVFLHFFGRRLGEPLSGWLASSAIGGAFVVAVVAAIPFFEGGEHGTVTALWQWMPAIGANLEILWDLDIEAREKAVELDLAFARIESLNVDPAFVRALADLVRKASAAEERIGAR